PPFPTRRSSDLGHQHTVMPAADSSFEQWPVVFERVVHYTISACHGHELRPISDEPACRYIKLDACLPVASVHHIDHFGFSLPERLDDTACLFFRPIDLYAFLGLAFYAVDFSDDNFRS